MTRTMTRTSVHLPIFCLSNVIYRNPLRCAVSTPDVCFFFEICGLTKISYNNTSTSHDISRHTMSRHTCSVYHARVEHRHIHTLRRGGLAPLSIRNSCCATMLRFASYSLERSYEKTWSSVACVHECPSLAHPMHTPVPMPMPIPMSTHMPKHMPICRSRFRSVCFLTCTRFRNSLISKNTLSRLEPCERYTISRRYL